MKCLFQQYRSNFTVPFINGLNYCTKASAYSLKSIEPGLSSNRQFAKQPLFSKKPRAAGDAERFVDYRVLKCESGNGGDGMISFLREYRLEFGGPDGGNGGHGGHVIFKADRKVTDLSHVSYYIKAKNGGMGGQKCCHGKSGEHTYVSVPLNTLIKRPTESHRPLNEDIIHELRRDGEMFIAARGGCGGHGNNFYLSNLMRKPVKAETGGRGEIVDYELEMRVMATAGLVGFPNAGKSSLLRAISRSRTKVASYPFTTLQAHVGVVQYDDFNQVAVADIPGLIEGAHKNEGLGFSFLRHVCRCECIFYVLDYTLNDIRLQFDVLQQEVALYDANLSNKLAAVIVNKADMIKNQKEREKIRRLFPGQNLFFVSAQHRTGLGPLLTLLRARYDDYIEKRKNIDETVEE